MKRQAPQQGTVSATHPERASGGTGGTSPALVVRGSQEPDFLSCTDRETLDPMGNTDTPDRRRCRAVTLDRAPAAMQFLGCSAGKRSPKRALSVPERLRQRENTRGPRQLGSLGQSARQEKAAQAESPGDCQRDEPPKAWGEGPRVHTSLRTVRALSSHSGKAS